MSWKPVVQTDSTGKWYENGLRFETKEEALTSARDLMNRWWLVLAADAHEAAEPVNAQLIDDKLELI